MSKWEWLSRSDAAVNWGGRLWTAVQWLWPILGPTIVAVVVVGLGWVLYGLLWGLLLALLAALVTQIIATLKAQRDSVMRAQPAPESESEDSPPGGTPSVQEAADSSSQQADIPTLVRGTDERPWVEDDELWEKTYERRSFCMAEFAQKIAPSGEAQAVIRDRRFYDCRIYGPVIFGPLSPDEIDKVFVDCEWIEGEEIVFWPPSENRQEYIGAVRLEDCRFEGCRLSRVGVLKQEIG